MAASCPWASQMIEIKSRSGWVAQVYEPLIRNRWPFYAQEPNLALQKLQQLPPNTIQAILGYLYANTPIAKTNLPAFKACKILDSIPFESTFYSDMLHFLGDESSSDFSLLPRDSDQPVRVHRFMLSTRSAFFKAQFATNPSLVQFRDSNMSHTALTVFSIYLYTAKLEPQDPVSLVDLFGAGKTYQLRDQEEIDFLAMRALHQLISPQNAPEIKARAQERNLENVINFVNQTFPC